MKIAQIRKYDVANGPGIRTTIFVSGCTHNCKNCFNKEYQAFNFGREFTNEIQDEIIEMVKKTKRLSVLGGEPLQQGWKMVEFLKTIKDETGANIWMWTGYTFEEIISKKQELPYQISALQYVDVLVDGRFIDSKKDLKLKFRGSSNQRVIDVKKTLENRNVVLVEGY